MHSKQIQSLPFLGQTIEGVQFRCRNIKKVLLEIWAPNCEIVPAKCLFFKSQKVTAIGYYGIENPLPDINKKTRRFSMELLNAACWLSSTSSNQNG